MLLFSDCFSGSNNLFVFSDRKYRQLWMDAFDVASGRKPHLEVSKGDPQWYTVVKNYSAKKPHELTVDIGQYVRGVQFSEGSVRGCVFYEGSRDCGPVGWLPKRVLKRTRENPIYDIESRRSESFVSVEKPIVSDFVLDWQQFIASRRHLFRKLFKVSTPKPYYASSGHSSWTFSQSQV